MNRAIGMVMLGCYSVGVALQDFLYMLSAKGTAKFITRGGHAKGNQL